jgi:subtilase family serine protease
LRTLRLCLLFASLITVLSTALVAQTAVDTGLAWLGAHQNANGTWGSTTELTPRDTARALLAQSLLRRPLGGAPAAYAWLGAQSGFGANQFLAEQALALNAAKLDDGAVLVRLAAQRSATGADYGGFADNTGDALDSALALQALATKNDAYTAAISALVTSLMVRQNADGGWGIDQAFASNTVITAEVLMGFAALRPQQQPPATVMRLAQQYLAAQQHADGSIGNGVLETATAFRALAVSAYPLSATATATLNWLTGQRAADGSWSGDAYLTARVLEAFASNKPNLVIASSDITVTPTTVIDSANVTVNIKVNNTGAASAPATTIELHLTDITGRKLGAANINALAPGASQSATITFAATTMTGSDTLFAIVDPAVAIDELRKDDDSATAALTVNGKPDLQVYAADLTTTPAHVQPNQPATLNAVIRNNGEGDATSVAYVVLDGTAQLVRSTIATIPAGTSAPISVPLTLAAGSHTLTATVDPDNAIPESNETNNQASKTIGVSALANIDLRIAPGAVSASPGGATAGQSVTITATVENIGNLPAQSVVAFFDGDPSLGRLITQIAVSLDAQTATSVQATYVVQPSTSVVYAVVDPWNALAETDETNNAAYTPLSSQFVDLAIAKDGFVLTRTPLQQGQQMTGRAVVRNLGAVAATHAEVILYDDIPQLGGNVVVDTFVDVPAFGKVVVPATWTVRAGQRIATAVVNPSKSISEVDYANNKVTRLYVVSGNEADIALAGTRAQAIDTTGVVVDASALTISGLMKVTLSGNAPRPFGVTIFDDADGDLAFNPDVDTVLGTATAQAGLSTQLVEVPLGGLLRYAPGHLVLYLDSSNSIAETNESNNLIDLWQDCQGTTTPSPTSFYLWRSTTHSSHQASVARMIDTNGDDVIDDWDVPTVVTTVNGTVVAMRGDTGQVLWSRDTDANGTNVVPVIGDVDGDGRPEIIAHSSDGVTHKLICLNADGSTKWESPSLDRDPNWEQVIAFDGPYGYIGLPVVADLDGDGKPEVISGRSVLNGADGSLKWVGTAGAGRVWGDPNDFGAYFANADLEGPIAVDVNGDGKLEVVAGNTAYRADGSILWFRGDLPDGLTAPVYVPNQTTPNICLVAHGSVWVLSGTTGATVWGPVPVPGGATFGGAPTVFMDGATGPWIGVAGEGHYSVLSGQTGAVRWSVPTLKPGETGTLTQNAATAFDFGAGERLSYNGQSTFYIFRASDGSVEQSFDAFVNLPFPGAPTIADIDGDGHADIYVPDYANGFGVITNKTWNGAPSIYNEASYHVTNVANDRALIPAHETQTAFSRGNWRANAPQAPAAGATPQPNLTAGYPRIDASHYPLYLRLIVRVGNNGWAASDPVNVSFFRADTNALLGVSTSHSIPAGAYEDVVYQFANPPLGAFSFYAIADNGGQITECNEGDNRSVVASTTIAADIAIDPASVVASDTQPLPNTTIDLTASAAITGSVDATALKARFFLGSPTGTPISDPLPVVITANPDGSRTASVTYSWTVNVAVGPYDVWVVFDPANAIAETSETNNSGHTTIDVSASQNADIATDNSLLVISDPQPRPGDTIRLGASAHLSGQFDASLLKVQFFNGDPAAGGTAISPALPVTITTYNNSFRTASASYDWTVSLPTGNYTLFAVFDPSNAIAETNETNNTATTALQVSSAQLIKQLSATVTLTPPSAEAGTPVNVSALVQNSGNATLDAATLQYTVTSGGSVVFQGSQPIAALAKNALVNVSLGSFTPQSNGTYTVRVGTAETDITVIADPKTLTIAPFGNAQVVAVPPSVPISLPMVQVRTHLSRTNTIVLPDDPLVPLLKAHLQSAVNWQQQAIVPELSAGCYRCHVHAQALVGLGASSAVSGVTVNTALVKQVFNYIKSFQNSDGSWFNQNYVTSTTSAVWAMASGDPTDAQAPLTAGLNWLAPRANADGAYTCDECRISFGGRETVTMFSMVAFARGWEQTRDPSYQNAMVRLTKWALAYDYQSTAASGPEYAARIGIGLAAMIPDLQDTSLQAAAKARLQTIAQFLRSQQNPDGSFGALPTPDFPVIRTAQSLYVLALAGTPGSDPGLRNAILWLINHQLPSGAWSEWRSEQTSPVNWWDETTWAMIALPAAFLRLGQFDVDYRVFLPSTSDLSAASPPPTAISVASGGKQLVWHLSDVSEAGTDVAYNVKLNGLAAAETRAATGPESISYTDPYGGNAVTRDLQVPAVTGYAPIALGVTTDRPSYGPSTPVTITETLTNLGTATDGITNDLQIRDANGLTVATVASGDAVQGFPPSPFPNWHATVPLTAPVTADGVNRTVTVQLDFAQLLATLGMSGVFDPNSIRVSSDDAPSTELYFSWFQTDAATPARGLLSIRIPDALPAGATFSAHVFFDVVEHGFKPLSQYSTTFNAAGGGLLATYGYLDNAHMNPNGTTPDTVLYVAGPPAQRFIQQHAYVTSPAPPRGEYWGTEWTGALVVPSTGTYSFLLGSDDGAWLYIDGRLVINLAGLHPTIESSTSIPLTAGTHAFRVVMFNWCCGWSAYVHWAPPGQGWSDIPTANLLPQAPSGGATLGTPTQLTDGTVTLTYVWNSGTTAAAPYTAVGTIRQYGGVMTSGQTAFTITPASQLDATVSTDRTAYDPQSTVHVSGAVVYTAGNTPLTSLSATIAILNPSGATIATSPATAIASLVPGGRAPVAFDWSDDQSAPGQYSARVVVTDASGAQRATASVPFTIRSSSDTGRGISGTITTPASVDQGDTLPITASIANNGNTALTNAPFSVLILDPATQNVIAALDFTASIASGQSATQQLSWPVGLANPQTYSAVLVSHVTSTPVQLATASFAVKLVPTIVTAAVATDRPAYDVRDTVHATTSVTLSSAPLPLTNVAVAASIADPNGTVIATNAQTIATLTRGTSIPLSFDWNTGTSLPGTYTLTSTAGNDLAHASTTFVIRSTAVTGVGVTGTLNAPPLVTQGDPLPITATITDNGNAALANAPFAVTIASDTLSFTASVAMGASSTQQLTEPTAALPPGSYTITLVSRITGTPVTLATTNVIVQVRTVVTDVVATDRPAYDPGDTLHGTSTITCVSAPAPLTNLSVHQTIDNVATFDSTIASLAPGATTTATFDWPVTASTPPGTYTLTSTVGTLAHASTTFVIRSTAVTGIGITGALNAPSLVTQGDPLPIAVTITDNGNAALTNAPFSVTVASDTLPFTASVGMAASTTQQQLTEPTAALTPGTYTITLVSLITGTPVTLATTSVVVQVRTVVTDAVATDRPAYDPGDTLHGTSTITCVSAPAPLTNVPVHQSIDNLAAFDSTIASLAPGATTTTSFDWSIDVAIAPGTYTLRSVVGNDLAYASTTFIIRSTAVTGIGITGTLTAAASVVQGDPLPLTATIHDNGNAALTNAPFAVTIAGDTLPFTLSVPLAGAASKDLTYDTHALQPGNYMATLVSRITGTPVTLATARFTVKPPVSLTVGSSSVARVLIWADCSSGNNTTPCPAAAPPFLTQTLTAAGIPWTLVGEETAFLAQLRTGGYTAAILDPPPTAEPKIAAEVSESIHAGVGVLLIHDHPDAMPKLADALGISYNGTFNATSTLLDILATPVAPKSQMSVSGDGVRITLGTAKSVALVSATQLPAISYNIFGGGRVVVLPFDAEKTTTPEMAAFLLGAVTYVGRAAGADARSVVALDVAIGAPAGGSQSVVVNVSLLAGMTIVDAQPQLTTTSSWSVTVPGGTTTHLTLRVRLPEAIGGYDVGATLLLAGQPLATKIWTLHVTADEPAIASALANDLSTIAAKAPTSDQHAIDDAQSQLAAIRPADPPDAVARVLAIVDDLARVSIDTTAARIDADRLLLYWQSRVAQ